MKKLVDKDQAKESDYAYLLDRVLINTGKSNFIVLIVSLHTDSTSYEVKPCDKLESLNERRIKSGMSLINICIQIMNENYLPKKEDLF